MPRDNTFSSDNSVRSSIQLNTTYILVYLIECIIFTPRKTTPVATNFMYNLHVDYSNPNPLCRPKQSLSQLLHCKTTTPLRASKVVIMAVPGFTHADFKTCQLKSCLNYL